MKYIFLQHKYWTPQETRHKYKIIPKELLLTSKLQELTYNELLEEIRLIKHTIEITEKELYKLLEDNEITVINKYWTGE